jgi:hypothetical protein
MATETKEKEINGCTYSTLTLGAVQGKRVLVRLTKMAGPALASISDAQKDPSGALGKVLETLSEEDIDFLCTTFAARSSVTLPDGKQPQLDKVFDSHFAGDYMSLVEWLAFCVMANYADFFSGVMSRMAEAAAKAKATTPKAEITPST